MKKPDLMQETMSTRKPRQKGEGIGGEERRHMIGYQFILKKPSIWGYNFYGQCPYEMASIETTSGVLS